MCRAAGRSGGADACGLCGISDLVPFRRSSRTHDPVSFPSSDFSHSIVSTWVLGPKSVFRVTASTSSATVAGIFMWPTAAVVSRHFYVACRPTAWLRSQKGSSSRAKGRQWGRDGGPEGRDGDGFINRQKEGWGKWFMIIWMQWEWG